MTIKEIKFRAWDKKYLQMTSWEKLEGNKRLAIDERLDSDQFIVLPKHENVILMQYTGFKDKNSKEIYEGDVIKVNDKIFINNTSKALDSDMLIKDYYSAIKTVVFGLEEVFSSEWHGECMGFHLMPHEDIETAGRRNFNLDGFNIYEVIGNIYENPDLLDNQKSS